MVFGSPGSLPDAEGDIWRRSKLWPEARGEVGRSSKWSNLRKLPAGRSRGATLGHRKAGALQYYKLLELNLPSREYPN